MISEERSWEFTTPRTLVLWYGHVELLENHVVGQWFCLARDSGSCLWDRRFWRINAIQAVADGVIVASETRSDGPGTGNFGCYGIDLETGSLRWVSHRNGVCGKLVRMLDFFPGFTNEFRDVPLRVEDRQVFCASGRVLDIQSGRLLRKEKPRREKEEYQYSSDAHRLYMTHNAIRSLYVITPRADPVEISRNRFISYRHPDDPEEDDGKPRPVLGRPLYGFDAEANILWQFRPDSLGFFNEARFFSYRLVSPYVYFVVSDREIYVPVNPEEPNVVRHQPGNWKLLVLDARDGQLVQQVPLTDGPREACRIEDVDENGLLISFEGKTLHYYQRQVAEAQP